MAFGADCGSSTVLEAFLVARAVGFLVPEEGGAAFATRGLDLAIALEGEND